MKVDHFFPGPPGRAADTAAHAAALGHDGFFTAETAHDPFLPLAIAAPSGLELGTAIAVAFPRSPMVTAQVAWDLASITGGRFVLGLGTQVEAHIVRRFSGTWDSPVDRLREYVEALRSIWRSFQTGERLAFEGTHYRFSLLTPFFDPGPIEHPDVPVAIAGVGPALSRLAGESCDGFHVHPFHTVRYLDEVTLPHIERGALSVGRTLADVDRIAPVFVVSGSTGKEMAERRAAVRRQIAFYASTPSYRPVLDVHGWEFGPRLTMMSRRGDWAGMAGVVPDSVVDEVAVVGGPDEVGPMIRHRYGDRLQRVALYALADLPPLADEITRRIVADLRE